jgi:hypothetical protein
MRRSRSLHWQESNQLEAVDGGLVHSEKAIYTEYVDKSRDEWQMKTCLRCGKCRWRF